MLRRMTAAMSCPVCTATRFSPTFAAVGHRFERCAGCGFVRMADPLSSQGIADFYAADRLSGEAAWQEHEINLQRFDGILQQIERHVRPGRLLDVGCSIGTSLLAAQRRGWQAIGLELSQPGSTVGTSSASTSARRRCRTPVCRWVRSQRC